MLSETMRIPLNTTEYSPEHLPFPWLLSIQINRINERMTLDNISKLEIMLEPKLDETYKRTIAYLQQNANRFIRQEQESAAGKIQTSQVQKQLALSIKKAENYLLREKYRALMALIGRRKLIRDRIYGTYGIDKNEFTTSS